MQIEKFEVLSRRHRSSSWPQRLDHNGCRRLFYKLRWSEWEPCVQSGKSGVELVREALSKWQDVRNIEERMIMLGVGQLIARDTQGRKALVGRISNSPLFEIVLDPKRSTWNWIEDLGHELGHLEARQLGSKRLDLRTRALRLGDPGCTEFLNQSFIEEAFADRFGEAWSAIASHRRQARRLFLRLMKGD